MFLSADDLAELTGRRRPAAQCRQLARMGSLYLFANDQGKPLTAKAVGSQWERLRRRAGVADAHFHDLRATALTWAKEAAGIDFAQALAGHASSKMTEAYVARRMATKVRPIR